MRNNYYLIRDSQRVFTKSQKYIQLVKQNFKCDCCGDELTLKESKGGHILSWADGNKTDAKTNLVVLCQYCNSAQSSMPYDEFKKKFKDLM